jgi:hypothetical protein
MWSADIAHQIADDAEDFAAYLENSEAAPDQQRRMAIATAEHEVARIAKQNVSRLRDLNTTYRRGERLPKLPGTTRQTGRASS